MPLPKEGLDSFATIKTTAIPVTPESGLVLEDTMMTVTRVETKLHLVAIMGTRSSRPWSTSWYNKVKDVFFVIPLLTKNLASCVKIVNESTGCSEQVCSS